MLVLVMFTYLDAEKRGILGVKYQYSERHSSLKIDSAQHAHVHVNCV